MNAKAVVIAGVMVFGAVGCALFAGLGDYEEEPASAGDPDGDAPDAEAPQHCRNEVKDEGETDLNCGGQCAPCDIDKQCANNTDCVTGRCTESKCVAWARVLSALTTVAVRGVATDSQGNVFAVGSYSGAPADDLVPQEPVPVATSYGFAVKYNPDGTRAWLKTYPASVLNAVATNRDGVVIAVGTTAWPSFDGRFTSTSGFNVAVATLDPKNGAVITAQFFGATGNDIGETLAVADDGSFAITGSTSTGAFSISEAPPPVPAHTTKGSTVASTTGGFVAKFDRNGTARWTRSITDFDAHGIINSASFGENGDLFVSGALVTVAPTPDAGVPDQQGRLGDGGVINAGEMFVARLGGDGRQVWVKTFPIAAPASLLPVLGQAAGNVAAQGATSYVAGYVDGVGPDSGLKVSRHYNARLDGDGNPTWQPSYACPVVTGGPNLRGKTRIVVKDGEVYIFGDTYCDSLTLGGNVRRNAGNLGRDLFVAKLDAQTGIPSTSYAWGTNADEGLNGFDVRAGTGNVVIGGEFAPTIEIKGIPLGVAVDGGRGGFVGSIGSLR